MTLTLHTHPLASFCMKVVIGLYERDIPFEANVVDLSDPAQRDALCALWPFGKFPVLSDAERGLHVPETSIILEYLDEGFPDRAPLIPRDREAARACRLQDRFYDLYVNTPMAKVVTDKLRPRDKRDELGVAEAREQLRVAYGVAEVWMRGATWALGDTFSMADCAAAPALFYAHKVEPLGAQHPALTRYLERLCARPSFARVLREAEPYFVNFPG